MRMIRRKKINRCGRLLTLSLLYLPLLQACQQTQLVFTDARAPEVPVFNSLIGAPQITQVNDLTQANQLSDNADNTDNADLSLHLFQDQASTLNYIELVLINTSRPFNNVDILAAALAERAYKLAAQSALTCIESLQVKATIHSIRLLLACPEQETSAAIALLADSWQSDAFDEISIDNIKRQLKLSKHINAFSGGEIDKVWARLILGEDHIYNLALNNIPLVDNLTHQSLSELQNEMRAGSRWHLLLSFNDPGSDSSNEPQKQTELTVASYIGLTRKLAKQLEASEDMSAVSHHILASAALPSNLHKTLHIIDVPDAVQTQVRVGYALPLQSNPELISQDPLSCRLLASWLGRSFSGRLYYDLREQRGLTYGIYGHCFSNPLSRTLKYYGSTQLQHSGAFVAGILAHLQLAQSATINNDELDALKLFEQSKFTLARSSQVRIRNQYIKHLILGLSQDEIASQQAQIQRITAMQLQNIAQTIFHAPPMILIRGDLDKIRSDLNDKLPDWHLELIEP